MFKPFSYILFRAPVQSLYKAYAINPDPVKIFQEGLFLASPEFWTEIQKADRLKGKEKEKLELSLLKYLLRCSVRCTPYGTFAGSALASISDQDSEIILASNETHRRKVRLDMNYMTEIVNALVNIPVIKDQILFTVNNSLYAVASSFRYIEYNIQNNTRCYQLASVDNSPYLTLILSYAQQGSTLSKLSSVLMQEMEVTKEEATQYISELLLAQLLIPGLTPTITGAEPLDQLVLQMEGLKDCEDILAKLKDIQRLLRNHWEGVDYYIQVEDRLSQLDLDIAVPKNTVQTDLFLNTKKANLNKELAIAIADQAEELKALSREGKNAELDDFKKKFQSRYEELEMPLTILLDADLGIGYAGINDQSVGASEWVDGLAVGDRYNPDIGSGMDHLQQLSLYKYQDWLANNKDYIEVKSEEIQELKEKSRNYKFPNSMFLMGSLMKKNGLLNKDHFIFDVSFLGGPSAANLLGRFTHGDDKICQFTKQILEKEEEEYPDTIFAEIVHLQQARIGNILLRPVLRKYEIPYVGLSGIEKNNQVWVNDLYVSVRNDEVVLRSKRLNKRIIPRMTTAHNFGYNSLPVYKFLCDIQGQGLAYPNIWDWGHLTILKHLPRVIYKNLILQKATWKIEEGDIADLPKDRKCYLEYFQTFCAKLSIPRRTVYKEGDNELLIDFTENSGIELFLHFIRKYKILSLEEFLFTEQNCTVQDEDGNPFTNELIIPLYDELKKESPIGSEYLLSPKKIEHSGSVEEHYQRTFLPYSEWLYFKVYCGAKSAEKILSNIVLPFVEDGIISGIFEYFFFVRYNDDGGSHLRLRFYNKREERQFLVYRTLMKELQYLIDTGQVHKVVLDTYKREMERYTPELICETEILFYNDSVAVLRFINMLDGTDSEKYRMLFALRGIDMLLSDFGFSLEEKRALLKQLQDSFLKEFGALPVLRKQLNDRYRKYQQFFVAHFEADKDTEHGIDEAVSIFKTRSEVNMLVVEKILSYLLKNDMQSKVFDLLGSYIHMFINRLYMAQQRKYELVVYHFLDRYYSSRVARKKNSGGSQ